MKRSIVIIVVTAGALLFGSLIIRDVSIYINGGRPRSAIVDGLCDLFFGTTANCRKRRSIDLRFLRYEGLTAVA